MTLLKADFRCLRALALGAVANTLFFFTKQLRSFDRHVGKC
jgi:hypothetical protein